MKKLFGKMSLKHQYMMKTTSDSGKLLFWLRELMKIVECDPGVLSHAHAGWIPFPAWSSPDRLRSAWSCWRIPG